MIKQIIKYLQGEPKYLYFKKVTNKYHGLCGATRAYKKIKKGSGRFSYMDDMIVSLKLGNKGWVEIGKCEFES